jgi:hypothetical protein
MRIYIGSDFSDDNRLTSCVLVLLMVIDVVVVVYQTCSNF